MRLLRNSFLLTLLASVLYLQPSGLWAQVKYSASPTEDSHQLLIGINPITNSTTRLPMTAAEFGRLYNLPVFRSLASDPQMAVLNFSDTATARSVMEWLKWDPSVRTIGLNVRPNIVPFFVANDPLLVYQNHIPIVMADQAWLHNFTGQGVTIGIVDDGLERTHEDLAPNYKAGDSYDFLDRDSDPSPGSGDFHGTSVAGLAAARGGNAIGVSGTAPLASLAGLRIGYGGASTVSDFVDAVKYHSSGVLRTITVKNHSYGISAPFIDNSLESQAYTDSTAFGTIHLVAAGNSRETTYVIGGRPITIGVGDCNKESVARNPDVITVSALYSNLKFTSYSSYGACVTTCAPANSTTDAFEGVVTTDRTGNVGYNLGDLGLNYTTFNGTSAATPVASGIIALAKQSNPKLNTRTLKHLLARYSRKNDSASPKWITNGAGFLFNPDYGFGMIDADRLTQQAPLWVATTQSVSTTPEVTVNTALTAPVTKSVLTSATSPLEEVEIFIDMSGTGVRGNLQGTIVSPSGTSSIFCYSSAADKNSSPISSWWFTSNAFWGENPSGTWLVKFTDAATSSKYVWESFQLRFRSGSLVPAPPPINDTFAKAFVLTTPSFAVPGNTYLCTAEAGEPAHAGVAANHSLWWKWTASKTGGVLLKTEGSTPDTVLAVYRGNSVSSLTTVASNNDYSGGPASGLIFNAVKGLTYYFAIDTSTGESGAVALTGGYIPELYIYAADGSASEPGRDTGQVFIYRRDSLSLPINLTVRLSGSAVMGTHYKPVTTSLTIPANKTRVVIPIVVIDNKVKSTTRKAIVTINSSLEYTVANPQSAAVLIYDND